MSIFSPNLSGLQRRYTTLDAGEDNSLLLDAISVQPVVAYSPRKLRADYSGSIISVYDTVTMETVALAADGNGDLDASILVIGRTYEIVRWFDQSGNDNHADSTGAEKIFLTLNHANGKPMLKYANGAGGSHELQSLNQVSISNQSTYFHVYQNTDVSGTTHILSDIVAGNKHIIYFNGNVHKVYNGAAAWFGATTNNVEQRTTFLQPGDDRQRVNGAERINTNALNVGDTPQTGNLVIGNFGGANPLALIGYYGEKIVFNEPLSEEEITTIEESQKNYFGVV